MNIYSIALVEMAGKEHFNIYALTRMPRGIPLLAAIVQEYGYDVDCYVGSIHKIKYQELMDYDVIGFGIISCTAKPTYKMIKKLRSKGYAGQIIVGGPHATVLPEESLAAGADYVVRHEGDQTLPELLMAIENGDVADIAGITRNENGVITDNPDRIFLNSKCLSELPFPAFESIVDLERMNIVPITFSRGCPFQCEFCGVAGMYGAKYRATTVDWRVQQLRTLKREYPEIWQKCSIFFVDDNLFGIPETKQITIALLERMVAEDLIPPKGWICQMRIADATPETVKLIKDAGCLFACLGIESVDDKTLKLLHKEQTARDIEIGLANFKAQGVATLAMTIAGTDTDSFGSFWRSIRRLQKWGITYLQVLALVPLVGTKMTRRLRAEDREFDNDYDKHNGMHVVINPLRMSKFGVWASVYLIGFVWFYTPMIFRKDFKFRRLIWLGFVQLLKQLWRNTFSP